MSDTPTLAELLQQHFDDVLARMERNQWGGWTRKGNMLHHPVAGAWMGWQVRESRAEHQDYIEEMAAAACRLSIQDVADLLEALRDLHYADWLGMLE